MCQRAPRDEKGRLLPGSQLNPAGRGPTSRLARLLAEVERCGGSITISLPSRPAIDEPAPVPPKAA